ncbi:MAG: hypothetical protein K2X56_04190 [Mycobacterium pseudokansasii]|uniref:hypothetical protein n=1 Tax=Mycobacterium pseudokansasii TaxID=2341080 RepID=UPI0010A97BBA|nr:hypothetical protein [Mycobacterium pseudokansasii]MBY0387315.1 hypothetical protein [Mycobacterium pseudokansasii]
MSRVRVPSLTPQVRRILAAPARRPTGDATSLFLIRFIVAATPAAPAFLDPETLPMELRTLLEQV